jgi:hypothetical protein
VILLGDQTAYLNHHDRIQRKAVSLPDFSTVTWWAGTKFVRVYAVGKCANSFVGESQFFLNIAAYRIAYSNIDSPPCQQAIQHRLTPSLPGIHIVVVSDDWWHSSHQERQHSRRGTGPIHVGVNQPNLLIPDVLTKVVKAPRVQTPPKWNDVDWNARCPQIRRQWTFLTDANHPRREQIAVEPRENRNDLALYPTGGKPGYQAQDRGRRHGSKTAEGCGLLQVQAAGTGPHG